MFSYFEPDLIEKFLRESVFSNFAQNWNAAKLKIGYLAAILKRYILFIYLFFFFKIMIFYSAYIHGANFIAKFCGKVVFLGGVPWNPPPPLGTNGSKSTLVT